MGERVRRDDSDASCNTLSPPTKAYLPCSGIRDRSLSCRAHTSHRGCPRPARARSSTSRSATGRHSSSSSSSSMAPATVYYRPLDSHGMAHFSGNYTVKSLPAPQRGRGNQGSPALVCFESKDKNQWEYKRRIKGTILRVHPSNWPLEERILDSTYSTDPSNIRKSHPSI